MKPISAAFAALLLITAAPNISLAQSETPTEVADLDPVAALTELIGRIKDERGESAKKIGEINERLAEIVKSRADAEATFDAMIAAEKAKAELGNPDGAFVKHIETLAEQSRVDARQSLLDGYQDLSARFEADAEEFEESALRARQYFESLGLRISAIEAVKKKVVYVIKLRESAEAQKVINEGLAVMAASDERLAKVQKQLERLSGQSD